MKRITISIFTFITLLIFPLLTVLAQNYPFNGMIYADALVIHNAPNSLSSTSVVELAYGTKVKVLAEDKNNTYKIQYDNTIGYASRSYIINIDTNTLKWSAAGVEPYGEYCNMLKNSGFPESYCPNLYYLHSKHPSWIFKAENTGVALSVAAETEKEKSALQTTNSNYWLNGRALEADYYYVNASVVQMFLDPKNALYENLIFQFLDLGTSKEQVNDKAINYMATGNLAKYKNEYKEAGRVQGINPLHLLARSRQEGASKETYRAVTGTYTTEVSHDSGVTTSATFQGKTLDGFYNFYNIGAYPDSTYNLGAIGRGLAYAAGYIGGTTYGRPWNTQAKAIAGGADFLREQYVSRGQNTLYYEKFNVSPHRYYTIYMHQYMTNIYAPTSEAKDIYTAYVKGNLLNTGFTFLIPVYTDSGASNGGSNASSLSYNNYLSSLKVNNVLVPGFNKEIKEYVYNLKTDSNTVSVTATTEDGGAKVSGIGTLTFANNKIVTNVVVTAPSGTTRTIKLTINKIQNSNNNEVKTDDIVSKINVKVNGNFLYGISPGTNASTITTPVSSNGGNFEIKGANGANKSGQELSTGDKIIIKGTSDSKEYTIVVRGDINGDNKINIVDLLQVQKHILGKGNLGDAKFYAGDTNYDSKINIVDLLLIQKHILGKGNL